jgi:hypothetical protein
MALVDVVYDFFILILPEIIKSNSQRSRIMSSVSNREARTYLLSVASGGSRSRMPWPNHSAILHCGSPNRFVQ